MEKMPSAPPSSSSMPVEKSTAKPHPADERNLLASALEVEKGSYVTMTAEAFERWMVTGEGAPWPETSGSGSGTL